MMKFIHSIIAISMFSTILATFGPKITHAETVSSLYNKHVRERCIREVKKDLLETITIGGIVISAPQIKQRTKLICNHWHFEARLLPLLELHLSGALDSPIKVFPCDPSKGACPDPVPYRRNLQNLIGDPPPQLNKSGLGNVFSDPKSQPMVNSIPGIDQAKAAALSRKLYAERLAQSQKLRSVLSKFMTGLNKEISQLEALAKK